MPFKKIRHLRLIFVTITSGISTRNLRNFYQIILTENRGKCILLTTPDSDEETDVVSSKPFPLSFNGVLDIQVDRYVGPHP